MINIYFDFDNTLAYRTDGMWSDALYEVFLKNGIRHIDKNQISNAMLNGFSWHLAHKSHKEIFRGKTWWQYHQELFVRIIEGLDKDIKNPMILAKEVRDEYIRRDKWKLYPECLKVLEQLKKDGYKLYIITNHVPEFDIILNNLDIEGYFDRVFLSANIGYEKPHNTIYKEALNYSSENDINIMIGDNYEADILGALKVGMKAILVGRENIHNYNHYLKNLNKLPLYIKNSF